MAESRRTAKFVSPARRVVLLIEQLFV